MNLNVMRQFKSCSQCGSKRSLRKDFPCGHIFCNKHFKIKTPLNNCLICQKDNILPKINNLVQNEEPTLTKEQISSNIYAHFQALRDQIASHERTLCSEIHLISQQMIEKAKSFEESYAKSLNEQNANFSELELKQISNHIKSNRFTPPQPLFSARTLFGLFQFCDFRNYQFESGILSGDQPQALIKLCEFKPDDQWSLVYRATRDGFHSQNFHAKCDGIRNTLTIIKSPETTNIAFGTFASFHQQNQEDNEQKYCIFGGYASVEWDSTSGWKRDESAFLFSLTNKENKPCKMSLDPHYVGQALYCHEKYGPIFGGGHDICIGCNSNAIRVSSSNLGHTYLHARYALNEAKEFLTGGCTFLVSEIEVYQLN